MEPEDDLPEEAPEAPVAPEVARRYLGDQFGLMQRYVGHLATSAISHGLIGPRERETLWTRHVLNCAVLGELIPPDTSVIDVGSGAGLPGLVLAIARPDLHVTLIEPLLRRSTWLTAVIEDLEVSNVTVRRDRAEAVHDQQAQVVTSRAVARLDKLAGWCAPLVAPGGRILAIKGATVGEELQETRPALDALGVVDAAVRTCGEGVVDPATIAVELQFDEQLRSRGATPGQGAKRKKAAAQNPSSTEGGRSARAGRHNRARRSR